MPEWEGYVDAGAGRDGGTEDGPGTMCHRESGFMQELAQDAALNTHQNIWVDGSLRDGLWFEKVFIDLRRRFPTYKIAIFYVYAAEDVIRSRVQQRAAETGRDVPEKLLEASLHAADKSLGILMPYVDFVARINVGCTYCHRCDPQCLCRASTSIVVSSDVNPPRPPLFSPSSSSSFFLSW